GGCGLTCARLVLSQDFESLACYFSKGITPLFNLIALCQETQAKTYQQINMKESKGLEWWVVMLALIWLCGVGCFGFWEEERVALLQLKASINYPNGPSLPSWEDRVEVYNSMVSDCCYWEGVECNETTSHVIKLFLNSTRDGSLGDWYFNASLFLPFKELRNLDLSNNQLVGWVANEGLDFPA
ncbi:unnamed protein product, partial [Ilex paraguariensis]